MPSNDRNPTPTTQCPRENRRQLARAITLAAFIPAITLLAGCSPNEVAPAAKTSDEVRISVTPITPAPTGQHHPGRFVWHDLLTDDPETAKRFYAGLFGWTYETKGRYTTAYNNGTPVAGIAQVKFDSGLSGYWLPYLSVADVDQSLSLVEKTGATVLRGPSEMTNRGRFALIGDPEGARLVLLHSSSGDPAPAMPVLNGWLWDELWATDLDKAQRFYQGLAGYRELDPATQPQAAGAQRGYRVMTIDGRWAAGLTTPPADDAGSQWVPVVRIADLGRLMAQVDELDGQVLIKPDHALSDTNVALIKDPTGAVLMVEPWNPNPDGQAQPANDAKAGPQ